MSRNPPQGYFNERPPETRRLPAVRPADERDDVSDPPNFELDDDLSDLRALSDDARYADEINRGGS